MGRSGQVINRLLVMTGHHPTVIDKDAALIAGMKKIGIKSYYGDASRPELLHAAGVDNAELMVLQLMILIKPSILLKLLEKSIQKLKSLLELTIRCTYMIYIMLEQIFKFVKHLILQLSARKALRQLGMDAEIADEISKRIFIKIVTV